MAPDLKMPPDLRSALWRLAVGSLLLVIGLIQIAVIGGFAAGIAVEVFRFTIGLF